ncbi:peroxiredoxin family protein [Chloroflexota bacterium]
MRMGTKTIALTIGLLVFLGLASACATSNSLQIDPQAVAQEAQLSPPDSEVSSPDFTGVDVVTDQRITLSDFKGSVVLLNFVNYGCNQSLNDIVSNQLLIIRELENSREDFVPVSVFCGCCPEQVLRDFAQQNNLVWPWILDTDYSIVNDYIEYLRDYGYPTLVYIDQEQNIKDVSGYTGLEELSARLDVLSN